MAVIPAMNIYGPKFAQSDKTEAFSDRNEEQIMRHPFCLRALILYDNSLWKTDEKSYENYKKLCEAMGEGAISYENYEYWFNQYLRENYSRWFPRTRIFDIRGCILSDVLYRKPCGKSIDDLCDAFENQKIDKEDHDYWYKRFQNGHLFTRKTFSNLPNEIIAEIVEKCEDLESYLNLREVSRRLRDIVDRSKPAFKNINIECHGNNIIVSLNDQINLYSNIAKESDNKRTEKVFSCLKLAFNNPKLQLDILHIECWNANRSQSFKVLPNFFISLNHQLHVEELSLRATNLDDVLTVLKRLKSRVLKKLTLELYFPIDISRLIEMEQWKYLSTLYLFLQSIPLDIIVRLVETASQSIYFKSCEIQLWEAYDEGTIVEILHLQQTDSPEVFSIPNSDLVLEFVDWCCFGIDRF